MGDTNLALGGLVPWILLAWVSAIWLPMGSYLFLWPTVFAAANLVFLQHRANPDLEVWPNLVVTAVCMVPGLYLMTQLIYALPLATSLTLVAALVALVVFLMGTMQLPLSWMTRQTPALAMPPWSLPALAMLAALSCFLAASRSRTPSAAYPKPSSLLYVLDADSGEAYWMSDDERPDAWTRGFIPSAGDPPPLPSSLRIKGFSFPLVGKAPQVPLAGPDVTVIQDEVREGVHCLRLRIQTAPEDYITFLHTEASARVSEIRVDEKLMAHRTRKPPYRWPLWLESGFGRSFDVELKLDPSGPFPLGVVRMLKGLPKEVTPTSRPDWTTAMPFAFPDGTLVGQSFSF